MTESFDPLDPPIDVIKFLTERHLATLTTLGADGQPHVTPVGVTYAPGVRTARVITWATSQKAINVSKRPGQLVAVCQVDGGRWLTLYGRARVTDDPEVVREGMTRYAARYRKPKERPDRVVIEIEIDRIVGRA
jgi:F420H(2)-dependent biliverdin reductase